MHPNHIRIAQLTLSAVIAALGCHAESPIVEHCHQAAGDQTCAEVFGEERPFCAAPLHGCETADQFQGCVAVQPVDECYSPCGDGTVSSENTSCLGSAEDETSAGSSTETGGENGDGDGDGDDEQPPACGNGVVEGDEACDDGNITDDDECSNSCTIAACGDGILQAWNGETCDDGNTLSGDACAATCVVPGTIIWSRLVEGDSCNEAAVALADNGNIHVVSDCSGPKRSLTVFDPNGEALWTANTAFTTYGLPSVALTVDSNTVVGGQIGSQGQVRQYDPSGMLMWSAIVPLAQSSFGDVGVDDSGNIAAVGDVGNDGLLFRYTPEGQLEWFRDDVGDLPVRVASNGMGAMWVLRQHQIISYARAGDIAWIVDGLHGYVQTDIATNQQDSAYIVSRSTSFSHFLMTKLDSAGKTEWLQLHDDPSSYEMGEAVATLPNGGALVAGWTNWDGGHERDGLLSWYTSSGTLLLDVVYDGDYFEDADPLQGVAVSPDGYAVAVGNHHPSNGPRLLWLLKVAI